MIDIDKADAGKIFAGMACAVALNLVVSMFMDEGTVFDILTLVTPTIIVFLFLQVRTLVVRKLPSGYNIESSSTLNSGTFPCAWKEGGADKILVMSDTSILRDDCTDVIAAMGEGSVKWYLIPSLQYYMDNMDKVKRKLPPDVYGRLEVKVNALRMGLE